MHINPENRTLTEILCYFSLFVWICFMWNEYDVTERITTNSKSFVHWGDLLQLLENFKTFFGQIDKFQLGDTVLLAASEPNAKWIHL